MFRKFAHFIANVTGTSAAFMVAILIVVVWGTTGSMFGYSDTWQLVINTFTTITTFMMVFLIQNTQNRNDKAVQLKLDELIRSTKARDAFVNLEELTDEELAALNNEFHELHAKQATSVVMKKLHKRIELEHARRKGIDISTSIGTLTDHIFPVKKLK